MAIFYRSTYHFYTHLPVVPYINRTLISTVLVYGPGNSILLDCPAVGIPAPTIQWTIHSQGNTPVNEIVDAARLRGFQNGSLELRNLTFEDEGVYSCHASNSVGSDTVYVVVVNREAHRFGKFLYVCSYANGPFYIGQWKYTDL